MALFAKKVEYWASMTSYVALLIVAKKKGGTPISHIVYAYNSPEAPFVMRSFFSHEDAKKGAISQLAGYFSKSWDGFIVTSSWLHRVASGGGYQYFAEGTWVRVPVPKLKHRFRKRRSVQFGDYGFLYRQAKEELSLIKSDYNSTRVEIDSMNYNIASGYEEDENELEALETTRDQLEEKMRISATKVNNLLNEMRFVRSKKTGIPLKSSFCKEEIV